MEQEGKVLHIEIGLQHKSTSDFIINASARRQKILSFTYRVISSVGIGFVRLVIKVTQAFLSWVSVALSELGQAESKNISDNDMDVLSKSEIEQFTVVWHEVGIVLIRPLLMIPVPAGRHYTLSNPSDISALKVVFRAEIERDPCLDVLPSGERKKKVVKNMCNTGALQNLLKQCIVTHAVKGNMLQGTRCSSCWAMALC